MFFCQLCSNTIVPALKLLVYSRYVLSKLSWHFTVATLSKTWVIENIDPVVIQTCNKFGKSIYPPSVKFIKCQTVLRQALKLSPNESINELWKFTNTHTNIQYDVYNSTKEVLKDFRSEQEEKLQNQLTCQGSFFSSVTKFFLSKLNKMWSTAQSKLPKNIFSFTICYINNSLPTGKNLNRWGISLSPGWTFCLGPESLLHVVLDISFISIDLHGDTIRFNPEFCC